MTRQRHLPDGRVDLSVDELITVATEELARIRTAATWLNSLTDGNRTPDPPAASRSSYASDQVDLARGNALEPSRIMRRTHARMRGVVNTLASIADAMQLDDPYDRRYSERPLEDDPTDRGVSAYRGDTVRSATRDDLQEALDAQRRRLARGQGYGDA